MATKVEIARPKLQIDPTIEQDPTVLSLVNSASGWIPQVFQDRTGDFDFSWEWTPTDPQGYQLHLKARGLKAEADTQYRLNDLSDALQLKRKMYELKGDLLGQETRKSLDALRDFMLSLTDTVDVDAVEKE